MNQSITGAGFSLRSQYFSEFLKQIQPVAWLELVADQYLDVAGITLDKMLAIKQHYPVTLHCVSMNIAGIDDLNTDYLSQIKQLVDVLNPVFVSDHCCWSAFHQQYSHDLLPFRYQKDCIDFIANRIDVIQNYLQKPLLLENLSHYVPLDHELSEAVFLNTLCERTGCGILLDINNVYVSSQNMGYDAKQWLSQMNPAYVKQMHLAGHTQTDSLLIDTHSKPIPEPVWQLYRWAIEHMGAVATCLEWDNDLPNWNGCKQEIEKIAECLAKADSELQSLCNNDPGAEAGMTNLSKAGMTNLSKAGMTNLSKAGMTNTTSFVIADTDPQSLPTKIIVPKTLHNFQQQHWQQLISTSDLESNNPWSIHQNSMRMQRIKALQQVFGVIEKIVGSDYWQQLCLQFVLTHPSQSANINADFALFSPFLAAQIPEDDHPLVDLAAYLWAWYQTYQKNAPTPTDLQSLHQALQQSHSPTLHISSAITLLKTNHPIVPVWEACQPEYQGQLTAVHQLQHAPNQNTYYILCQQQQRIHTVNITEPHWLGLQLFTKPITLDAWISKAESIHDLEPEALSQWFADGLITLQDLNS